MHANIQCLRCGKVLMSRGKVKQLLSCIRLANRQLGAAGSVGGPVRAAQFGAISSPTAAWRASVSAVRWPRAPSRSLVVAAAAPAAPAAAPAPSAAPAGTATSLGVIGGSRRHTSTAAEPDEGTYDAGQIQVCGRPQGAGRSRRWGRPGILHPGKLLVNVASGHASGPPMVQLHAQCQRRHVPHKHLVAAPYVRRPTPTPWPLLEGAPRPGARAQAAGDVHWQHRATGTAPPGV